jgi:hypothetical protein
MTNSDLVAIREFRRFANTYLYQDEEIKYFLLNGISNKFRTDNINFITEPQLIITFDNRNKLCASDVLYAVAHASNVDILLPNLFYELFNDPKTIRLIRNKIYNNINDEYTKQILHNALYQIQIGNQEYIRLLYNVTLPKNTLVYLYL